MCVNGRIDLLQRVALDSCAQDLAMHVMQVSKVRFDAKALADALVDYVHLDYQSQAVVEVYRACTEHIISGVRSASHRVRHDRQ